MINFHFTAARWQKLIEKQNKNKFRWASFVLFVFVPGENVCGLKNKVDKFSNEENKRTIKNSSKVFLRRGRGMHNNKTIRV